MRIHDLFAKRPELLTDDEKAELMALEKRFREGLDALSRETGLTMGAALKIANNAIVAVLEFQPVPLASGNENPPQLPLRGVDVKAAE